MQKDLFTLQLWTSWVCEKCNRAFHTTISTLWVWKTIHLVLEIMQEGQVAKDFPSQEEPNKQFFIIFGGGEMNRSFWQIITELSSQQICN
jgi:hypothetical protein